MAADYYRGSKKNALALTGNRKDGLEMPDRQPGIR
jgi:hypothetical protein